MEISDWKRIADDVEQPVIVTARDGLIKYANRHTIRMCGENPVGKPFEQIVDRGAVIGGDIALLAGNPVKISKVNQTDGGKVFIFTEVTTSKTMIATLLDSIDLYGFIAKPTGDFLGTTKKLRRLLNQDQKSSFIEDGWTKFINRLRSEEVSGNTVREIFHKKKRFTLSVPHRTEGCINISWVVGRACISGYDYIIALGDECPRVKSEISRDITIGKCDSVIPLIINKCGVQLIDIRMNEISKKLFDDHKKMGMKSIMPVEDEREKIARALRNISMGEGRLIKDVIKLCIPTKPTAYYAVEGQDIVFEGVPSLMMMAIDIDPIMKRVSRLEGNKRMLESYNNVLGCLVKNDSIETVLKLITEEFAKNYSAKSKCVGVVRSGIFKPIWQECDRKIPSEYCRIANMVAIKAVDKNDILLSEKNNTSEIEIVVPLKFRSLSGYVMSFRLPHIEHSKIRFLYNLKQIIEIGLERIANQKELKRKTDNLEKLHSFRSEVLEAVNHDLKTPLTSIMGYAELMKMDVLKDDEKAEAVDSIAKSAETLEGLINNLSAYTSIVTRDTREKTDRLNFCDFIVDIMAMMKPMISKSNIECVQSIPEENMCIDVNRTKLEEIIINILSNALRYVGKGGKIEVRVDRLKQTIPRLTVSDDGPGIKDDMKEVVFEKYERDTDNPEGKGLGLYLTKKYIESVGGSIKLESPGPLGGATFHLLFPKCD
jgi:signal transduction histidine kinase